MKKTIYMILAIFLTICARGAESKDLIGKWIGMKGEFRWQIERFQNGTFELKFKYSAIDNEVITASGKWEISGNEYKYLWLKSNEADFEPDTEMTSEMIHALKDGILITVDPAEEREPGEDYFNMEIKVTKFPEFDLVKKASTD